MVVHLDGVPVSQLVRLKDDGLWYADEGLTSNYYLAENGRTLGELQAEMTGWGSARPTQMRRLMTDFRGIALAMLNEHKPTLASNLTMTKTTHPRTGEKTTALEVYLDNRERQARELLKAMVARAVANGAPDDGMTEAMAEEIVIEQVLDPRT